MGYCSSLAALRRTQLFFKVVATDPLNLVSGEDLSDVNFPLIACRSIEKFEILKPWGNLLLAK